MVRELSKYIIRRAWKPYEKKLRNAIYHWIVTGKKESLAKIAWNFGSHVYNNGGGYIFIDFDENRQRFFLVPNFMAWVIKIEQEVESACLNVVFK